MRLRMKIAVTVLFLFLLLRVVSVSLSLLNEPSDAFVALGVISLAFIGVVGPAVLTFVWRKRKHEATNAAGNTPVNPIH